MSLPRAFTALTGATAVSMAAQLVRGKLAAIFLGPAGVGIFNQLSVMWNLFQLGGQLGSFNGIVQHGAEAMAADDNIALRRLVSTSTLLLVAVSCLIGVGGVLLSHWLSDLLLHDAGRHAELVALMMLAMPFGVTAQIYRALLSSARAVPQLVKTQIISDVGAAIVFAALIAPLGLTGAILGFMATHFLMFISGAWNARRILGPGLLRPSKAEFRWSIVRSNVGFGASGLVMVALGNFSVLVVSRVLIGELGLEANGIFGNAWRIASVYLGGVTAATIGYYVPTLTRSEDDLSITREVNSALRFYLYVLPPIMIAIVAGAELIVRIILTQKFLPAAALLMVFVPAELIRILGDCVVAPFLAKRRIRAFTALNLVTWSSFVAFAIILIPRMGLMGSAIAYAIGMTAGACTIYVAAKRYFRFLPDRTTAVAAYRAAFILGGTVGICAVFPFGVIRLFLCTLLFFVWTLATLRVPEVRDAARAFLTRIKS
jgi:O-antigen/teichoic acid export membrane protein